MPESTFTPDITSGKAFIAGAPQSIYGQLLAASGDPGRETRYREVLTAAMAAGMSPHLAELHARYHTSPFMALKYAGTALPEDQERILERTIIEAHLRRRNAVNDLVSRGLVRALPDIGVYHDVWQKASELDDAVVTMELAGGPTLDAHTYESVGVPIPIYQKKFGFPLRQLMAARNHGLRLDFTHAQSAAQKVAELEENVLINGATLQHGGYNLYGYRTHPSRITSVSGADFGTAANIFTVFNLAIGALRSSRVLNGGVVAYTNPVQFAEMMVDHKSESDKTAMQRVLEIPELEDVKWNDFMPPGEMVLVVMNSQTIDLAIAQSVTSVPWETEGGAMQYYRVFSSSAPRIKEDANGRVGLVHVTGI